MQRAFVFRPFETKTDSAGKAVDFERVHGDLIAPALEATGLASAFAPTLPDRSLARSPRDSSNRLRNRICAS